MAFKNLVKHKQTQLSALMSSNAELEKQYVKQSPSGKVHLLRYYTRYENINKQMREVHYFVVFEGNMAIMNNAVDFVRTTNEKKRIEMLKLWENLP